jgi:hypothetical protein
MGRKKNLSKSKVNLLPCVWMCSKCQRSKLRVLSMVSAAFITQYSQSMGQYRQSFVRSDWPQELRRELRPSTNEKRRSNQLSQALPSFHPSKHQRHGHMVRVIHGLLKVLLGPAMPYHILPCGQPPLKRPYSLFRGGRPQSGLPAVVLLPFWIPHAIRLWSKEGMKMAMGIPVWIALKYSSIQVFKFSRHSRIKAFVLKHYDSVFVMIIW